MYSDNASKLSIDGRISQIYQYRGLNKFIVIIIYILTRAYSFLNLDNFWNSSFLALQVTSFAFATVLRLLSHYKTRNKVSVKVCTVIICFFLLLLSNLFSLQRKQEHEHSRSEDAHSTSTSTRWWGRTMQAQPQDEPNLFILCSCFCLCQVRTRSCRNKIRIMRHLGLLCHGGIGHKIRLLSILRTLMCLCLWYGRSHYSHSKVQVPNRI